MKLVLEGYKLRLVFKEKKRFDTFLNVFINFDRVSLICNIANVFGKIIKKIFIFIQSKNLTLCKKRSFPLRISSVNSSYVFLHIY